MTENFKLLWIDKYGYIKVGDNGTIIGKKGKMKPNNQNTKGYYRVHIGNHMYSVHRLVAEAWIPNLNNFPQVNHIDGDKSNNNINNLEWCDNKYNRRHAVVNDLSSAKITLNQANEIREKYNQGHITYQTLGEIYNLDASMIGYIIRGDSWNYELYKDN